MAAAFRGEDGVVVDKGRALAPRQSYFGDDMVIEFVEFEIDREEEKGRRRHASGRDVFGEEVCKAKLNGAVFDRLEFLLCLA